MTNSGWLDNLLGNTCYTTVPEIIQPSSNLDASQWKAIVNETKLKINNNLKKNRLEKTTLGSVVLEEQINIQTSIGHGTYVFCKDCGFELLDQVFYR